MSEELGQKSEELRRYHEEQAMAFRRIRELVGNPVEAVTKAHLYDKLLATGDPASARQTIPILVKYSRTMKDLLAEIQKVVPRPIMKWHATSLSGKCLVIIGCVEVITATRHHHDDGPIPFINFSVTCPSMYTWAYCWLQNIVES